MVEIDQDMGRRRPHRRADAAPDVHGDGQIDDANVDADDDHLAALIGEHYGGRRQIRFDGLERFGEQAGGQAASFRAAG